MTFLPDELSNLHLENANTELSNLHPLDTDNHLFDTDIDPQDTDPGDDDMTYIDNHATQNAAVDNGAAPDFADSLAVMLVTDDDAWRVDARCRDLAATMTHLFFSDNQVDMAQAKAICRRCTVSDECLAAAEARKEPWGIWGGELFEDGRIVRNKRPRGRPPKVPRPELVVDEVILPDLGDGDDVVKAS